MTKRISSLFLPVFLIVVVPFVNWLVLYKSFNLGLYGDDWLQLYNLWLEFDVRKALNFFDIRSYLGAYLPQYIFLGIIHKFAGYDPKAYFLISYLLKVFSSIAVYYLAKEISKKQLVAAVSTILFIVSAAGLETTDWVFNMNTFAGLGLFGFATAFYLRLINLNGFFSKEYFLFLGLLGLSLFVVPVRMHGAVPFLIMLELFLMIISKTKFSKPMIFRIVSTVLMLFIFVKAGSYGTPEYSRGRMIDAFNLVEPYLAQGKLDFLFYFFGMVGNIIVPDKFNLTSLINLLQDNFLLRRIPFNFVLIFSFLLFLINFLTLKAITKSLRVFALTAILGLIECLIGIFLKTVNPGIAPQSVFSILIGLNFFGLGTCIFLFRSGFNPYFVNSIVLSVFWVVCFSAVYWIYSPHLILETTSRYLTFGAVGVSIFFGSLIIEGLKGVGKPALKFVPASLLLFYLLSHFLAGYTYLNNLEKNRNFFLMQKSWGKLLREVPVIDKTNPSVFYFTTDNPASLYGVFTFGFWPRAGLEYKITDPEHTPLAVENYNELLDYVKTGEPLKKVHGRQQRIVKLENVYAFDFRNGELINNTEQIRKKLLSDITN